MTDLYRRGGKRFVDVVGAAALLVATAPLMAGVAAAIAVADGRPVLFRQQRPGRHGRPFGFIKFRTMQQAVGPDGVPLPDAARVTKLGGALRALSLDELPQLFNVLAGEMSLVGPRPLLMQYLPRYSARQARRHEALPGITGWAQVNGRNALSWEQKFELDVWYVENVSLLLDLRILALTALKVVRRDGISAVGHVTMPEFRGADEADR